MSAPGPDPGGQRSPGDGAALLDRLGLLGLCALVGIAPLVILPGNFDPANLPQSAFIQVSALLLLGIWVLRARGGGIGIPALPFGRPLLAALVWSGASIGWAHNRYEALVVWGHWAACGIVYLVAGDLAKGAQGLRALLLALLSSGVLVAGLGALQHLFRVEWVPQAFPPAATFANKNMAAQFVVMVLPVGVAFCRTSRSRLEASLFALATALLALFLLFASTRSAWLAVLVEAGLFLAWTRGRTVWRYRLWLAIAASVAAAFVVVAAVRLARVWSPAVPVPQAELQKLPASVVSVRERLAIWRNTLEVIRDHPLRGIGVGNLRIEYPLYARRAVADPLLGEGLQLDYAHNDYLQASAEQGLVGAGLLAWLGATIVTRIPRILRGNPSPGLEARGAMALGLAGILVDAFFSFPAYRALPPLLGMVYLGLLGAVPGLRGGPSPETPGGVRSAAPWALLLPGLAFLLAGVAGLGYLEYRAIQSDRYCMSMFRELSHHNWSDAIALAERARAYNPARGEPFFGEGSAYLATGQAAQAREAFQGFVDRYPNDMDGLANLGLAYAQTGAPREALDSFRKVVAIKPDDALIHYRMAALFRGLRDADGALQEYRLAARYAPSTAFYQYQFGIAALEHHSAPEAEEALGKALVLSPGSAAVHKALGVLLLDAPGRRKEALEHLKRALALDPHIKDADQMRQLVETEERPQGSPGPN